MGSELVTSVALLSNGKGGLSCADTMKEKILGLYGEDDFIKAEEGLKELGLDDVTVNGTSAAVRSVRKERCPLKKLEGSGLSATQGGTPAKAPIWAVAAQRL